MVDITNQNCALTTQGFLRIVLLGQGCELASRFGGLLVGDLLGARHEVPQRDLGGNGLLAPLDCGVAGLVLTGHAAEHVGLGLFDEFGRSTFFALGTDVARLATLPAGPLVFV